MRLLRPIIILALVWVYAACGSSPETPGEEQAPQTITTVQNKGSDTMVNLALAWAEKYQSLHPEINISVTGGGSGTGIASLTNNTVDIANASRAMKDEEKEAMPAGTEAVEFTVARDAIAIIVNLDNPVNELTLQQISDIYSGKINNWKDVGGDDLEIVRLSRETNSGTHVYFLENVLRLGSKEDKTLFSTNTLLLPSSEGIMTEVQDNPHAIGYDGLGYVTPEVKVIAVAKEPGSAYVWPSVATVDDKSYPIARDLYMYTAGQPSGAIKDYIEWIFSPEAQLIVDDLGFVPILISPTP
jgi:phosphate transport system substrate-binding protein